MQIVQPEEYHNYYQQELNGRQAIGMSLGDLSVFSDGLTYSKSIFPTTLNGWRLKRWGNRLRSAYPQLGWDDARLITSETYTGPVSSCNLGVISNGINTWMFHLLYDNHHRVSEVPLKLLTALADEGDDRMSGIVAGGMETFVTMQHLYYRLGLVLINEADQIIADPGNRIIYLRKIHGQFR